MWRREPQGKWVPTAAAAVQIVSPNDEAWDKLAFYADRGVDELIIVDPAKQSVDWRGLRDGEHVPVERSALVDLGGARLAGQIDWPPASYNLRLKGPALPQQLIEGRAGSEAFRRSGEGDPGVDGT